MRVLSLDSEPLLRLRYLNAARGGGAEVRHLLVERAVVEGLPAPLDAVIATSDLQGVVPDPETRESVLLGVALAGALAGLALEGLIPAPAGTGVLLAGDLYSVPEANARGGFGDVRPVWNAFAARFRWVAGVAGNHDDVSHVAKAANARLLDMDLVELDGLRIAGVGLIAGNPAKRGRRSEADQLERLALACSERPDVLLLHEGPHGGDAQRGNPRVAEIVAASPPKLVVCGHAPWRTAVAHGSPQILNVCERVVVMVRGDT